MAGESRLQKKIKKKLQDNGWLVNKIVLCTINGWPDVDILKNGRRVLIEVKDKNKKLRPLQEYVHFQIKEHGGEVYKVDSWEEFLKLGL